MSTTITNCGVTFTKMDKTRLETIKQQYCESVVDNMSSEYLEQYVYEDLLMGLDDYSDAEIIEEISNMYPELLD